MATAQAPLEFGARHAEAVLSAIRHWADSGMISQSQASLLADSISVRGFDWESFAKHTMRLAVLFLAAGVGSTIYERRFINLYKRLAKLPPWLRSAATGLVAVGVHVFAYDRSQRLPEQLYANEAVHGVGAVLFAVAAYQLPDQLRVLFKSRDERKKADATQSVEKKALERNDVEKDKQERMNRRRLRSIVELCTRLGLATVYGVVAVVSKSNLIWSCSMFVVGLCSWQLDDFCIGRSPLLATSVGLSLIGASHLMRSYTITAPLWSTTRVWGLTNFFISLWYVSTGLHGYRRKLWRRIAWSLALLTAAGGSLWHGLRYDDPTTKGFGLTFMGINLWTRFYECCWRRSKPVYFGVLAGSFAVVGRYAETVWNLRMGSPR